MAAIGTAYHFPNKAMKLTDLKCGCDSLSLFCVNTLLKLPQHSVEAEVSNAKNTSTGKSSELRMW